MTKSLPKLVLSSSRDIAFSQLVLSQKNVRRVSLGRNSSTGIWDNMSTERRARGGGIEWTLGRSRSIEI